MKEEILTQIEDMKEMLSDIAAKLENNEFEDLEELDDAMDGVKDILYLFI